MHADRIIKKSEFRPCNRSISRQQPARRPASHFLVTPGSRPPIAAAWPRTGRLSRRTFRAQQKSEKCRQGVPKILFAHAAAKIAERQLRRLVVFPSQRPPSRTPQLRRGATAAAGCERSSAGPCGGRSTLSARPRQVASGAASRW